MAIKVNGTTVIDDSRNLVNIVSGLGGSPAGSIIYHAANTPPSGYVKANGASLSTSTYADLFSAIGYTFGGSGGSFNVPDLRGEFIRAWDNGRGVDSGRSFGSYQADEFRLHGHPYRQANQSGISNDASGGAIMTDSNGSHANRAAHTGTTTNSNTQAIGGSGGSETRPRNRALLACIKY